MDVSLIIDETQMPSCPIAMLLWWISKIMKLGSCDFTEAIWFETSRNVHLKSCKLIRSLHFLQRRHSSSERVSFQLNFILQSSWLISLPGRSNGLANPSGSYTVGIEDSTPFRFPGCSPLPNTKLIMSCSKSQWIPRALFKGKLSDFKSRYLMCGARSSTGNAD